MNNPYPEQQISEIVRLTLGQILGREPEEIAADDAIVNDLDADSLDFVEFRYTLERQLGITLPKLSVLDHLAEALGGNDQVYHKGGISELAAEVLRRSLFRYGHDQVRAGMRGADVMAVTTVGNWAAYCQALFDYLPDACPDCGGTQAKVSPAGKAVCAGCGSGLKPPAGDAVFSLVVPKLLASCADACTPA